MKLNVCFRIAALLLTAGFSLAAAEPVLPAIFSDHMVLQRDRKVPVWGQVDPHEKVTVGIGGQTVTVTADASGRFRADVGPFPAGGPHELTVAASQTVTVKDVLFGEVWLCSGQSNMELPMSRVKDGAKEIAEAAYPQIRLFLAPKEFAVVPQTAFKASWQTCTPAGVTPFSGVGYFFGRELYRALNVPVGLIASSWGGTKIEPWTTPDGFRTVPELTVLADEAEARIPGNPRHTADSAKTVKLYEDYLARLQAAVAAGAELPPPPAVPKNLIKPNGKNAGPSILYNAMIHPLVPYAIRGAIWYQGEANLNDGASYAPKMAALVNGWKKCFENDELPFFFVQLAPYTYVGDPLRLPAIWEAQQRFAETYPRAGMAVINDVGDLKDIHPTDKRTVGIRLAGLALRREYGKTELKSEFPALERADFDGGTVTLTFKNVEAWQTRDGKAPSGFELAGANGKFEPADAVLDGARIKVQAKNIAAPTQLRFAWHQLAEPNLANEAGLPPGAFRAVKAVLPAPAEVTALAPEAANYQLVYQLDLRSGKAGSNVKMDYAVDYSSTLPGRLKRIGYLVKLVDQAGKTSFVWTSMRPFTPQFRWIGVPTAELDQVFQQPVFDLEVKSNVEGVKNGRFERGNIEYWFSNYSGPNSAGVPGASDSAVDFGDRPDPARKPGYGSMQVHNTGEKQTVFAYNRWIAGPAAEIGIGNAPSGQPDWTFSGGRPELAAATMWILAEIE
jgi:sialate O-acetylesterase